MKNGRTVSFSLSLSYWNASIINIQLRELVPQVSYANSFMHSQCIRTKVMCEKWVFNLSAALNMCTTNWAVALFSIRYFNLSWFQLQCLLNILFFFLNCTDTNLQFFAYLQLKLICGFEVHSLYQISFFVNDRNWPDRNESPETNLTQILKLFSSVNSIHALAIWSALFKQALAIWEASIIWFTSLVMSQWVSKKLNVIKTKGKGQNSIIVLHVQMFNTSG